MPFVDAYDQNTGVKHRVPESWLTQPIGAHFKLTPKQKNTPPRAPRAPRPQKKEEIENA